MTYKLPEPDLYAHELLDNGGGVWLGVEEKGICEQAHVEGETGEEIRIYYTEAKVQAAYAAGLADGAPKWLPIESAEPYTQVLVWPRPSEQCPTAEVNTAGTWTYFQNNFVCYPTHWMPLPAAPEPKPQNQGATE